MEIETISYVKDLKLTKKDALIIVDMQYDFMPGGALAVEDGDAIIEDINFVAQRFKENKGVIIFTQDWHPEGHLSFASSHPGKEPGNEYRSEGIGPVLWPDHCVQGSFGARIHEKLNTELAHAIIRKGYNPEIDSYSAFLENDKKSETGLAGYLESLGVERIFVCGLALDYCCFSTAIDGIDFGFDVYFLVDLSRGIDLPPGNISDSLEVMDASGVIFVNKNSFI